MTNIEKLKEIGILEEIRQRLGAENENDESKDNKINSISNHRLIKEYCTWQIGDGTWWDYMKSYFDQLEEMI